MYIMYYDGRHCETLPTHFTSDEHTADESIWHGNFAAAEAILKSAIRESHDYETYHRLEIKRATLPLYELALYGNTEARLEKVRNTLNNLAEMLIMELDMLQTSIEDDRGEGIGRISELVMLCLSTRRVCQDKTPSSVFIPATQEDDHRGPLATDGYLMSIKGHGEVFSSVQVKTLVKEEDRQRYSPVINLIGLNQLDAHYGNQNHANSVSSAFLREIGGIASDEDKTMLNRATATMLHLITKQSTDGLKPHPVKPEWLVPA